VHQPASISQVDKVLASLHGKQPTGAVANPVVQQVSAKAVGSSSQGGAAANSFQISVKISRPSRSARRSRREHSNTRSPTPSAASRRAPSTRPRSDRRSARRSPTAALVAIIASLLAIAAYIALRFEWKYAVPVLIALMHDLLITAGVYALTGRQVTDSTVAALLTILGYSIYDTIIVFDRVRENVRECRTRPSRRSSTARCQRS
jgi:preprotein translocase SecF subunit